MRIEFLKPGKRSWLSSASSVARHMGLGRWIHGTWMVLLVIALLGAILLGASWLTVKELGRVSTARALSEESREPS